MRQSKSEKGSPLLRTGHRWWWQLYVAMIVAMIVAMVGSMVVLPGPIGSGRAHADTEPTTIIPYGATGYRYDVMPQGTAINFQQPGFDDSSWSIGAAPFGTPYPACGYSPQTSWPPNTDILVRKHFALPVDATNLQVSVAIDNDVQVFINGNDISGGLQTHEKCAPYPTWVFPTATTYVPASDLNPGGDNVIAVLGQDRGTSDLLDIQVTAAKIGRITTGGPVALPTPVPSVTSGTPTPTSCFSETIGGWTLTAAQCSVLAGNVDNVTVTAPNGLKLEAPLTIPRLPLNVNDPKHFQLPVKLPAVTLNVGAFKLTAQDLSVNTDGLTIGTATLTLPKKLAKVVGSVTATGVLITPEGHIAKGTITLSQNPLKFQVFGADVEVSDLALADNAITAKTASVNLPKIFRASAKLAMTDLAIHADGQLAGKIQKFEFMLGDVKASASDASLTGNGLSVAQANATFPFVQGNVTINGFSYDGSTISLEKGNGSIVLPPIKLGAVSAEATVNLALSINHNVVDFDLKGNGKVALPNIGDIEATIEIGSVNTDHLANLYHAELSIKLKQPIPIGTTPLRLVSISGDVNPSSQQPVTYTFMLGGDIQTVDGGTLFSGTVHGSIATNGNFGLGAHGKLIKLVEGDGGFCIRFVEGNDSVCKQSMKRHGDIAKGTGAYFELYAHAEFHSVRTVSATLDSYGHLWFDNGAHMAANAGVNLTVPAWSFGAFPPCAASAQGNGQIGTFQHNGGTVNGVKAALSGEASCPFGFHPSLSANIFVDQWGNFSLADDQSYQLQDQGGTAVVTTSSPARTRVHLLSARLSQTTATSRVTDFRVVPGQTQTFFTLLWRKGPLTLTLVAPDGTTYTPANPGAGNHGFPVSDPRGMPNGFRAGLVLYVPNPRPGLWHAQIGNLGARPAYRFDMNGTKPAPTLGVSAPRAGQPLVARPAAPIVTVAGTVTASAGDGTVSLSYVPASASAGKGLDAVGTLLSDSVPVRSGGWAYRWDTSRIPAGLYRVYATLNNGTGPLVTGYSAYTVRVLQSQHPGVPRAVAGTVFPRELVVHWQSPVRAALIAGYHVRWRTSNMPAGQWNLLDAGNAQRFVINRALTGVRYAAEVSSYDVSGHESSPALAHLRVKNPKRLVLTASGSLHVRQSGTLTGHLAGTRGHPVVGAMVTVNGTAVGLPVVLHRQTDAHGAATFSAVHPMTAGSIVVKATKPGYRTVTITVAVLP